MKKIFLLVVIIYLTTWSVFAAGSGEKAENKKTKTAVMGSGSMGGNWHATASMIATQVRKYTDTIITVQASGGSGENVRLMKQGEYQLALLNSAMIVYAMNSQAEFKGEQPFTEVRFVCNLYPNVVQGVVRKSANIQSYGDLKGKTISPGSPGSGDLMAFEEILDIYGLTTKDVDWRPLSNTERVSGFKDRIVDCAGYVTAFPAGNILESSAATPIRLLSLADKKDEFLKKYPYYEAIIVPKGTYNGVDEDITTVSVGTVLAARADVSDEIVYDILKGMYMGLDELQKVHGMGHYIKLETGMNGRGDIPVHPGALKYFKEVGVIK